MYVLGVVLVIIGVLGFFSGETVLGIFAVDTLHNIIHLASGVLALIFASRGADQARTAALVLGIVYALVTILGFLGGDSILGFIANNASDNWLHLVLAVVFLIFGMKKSGSSMPAAM